MSGLASRSCAPRLAPGVHRKFTCQRVKDETPRSRDTSRDTNSARVVHRLRPSKQRGRRECEVRSPQYLQPCVQESKGTQASHHNACRSSSASLAPAKERARARFSKFARHRSDHPSRTSENIEHKLYDSSAAFDLKFLYGPAPISAGTSNRRHWTARFRRPCTSDVSLMYRLHRIPPRVS